MSTATEVTFDEQLQRVREGLDKRAAHKAVCLAFGKLSWERFEKGLPVWSDKKTAKWFETKGARIEKEWGTKIADSLVAHRDLFTKIEVVSGDTLRVWAKDGQIDNLLKLGEKWGADEFGMETAKPDAPVLFWWD